MKNKILIIICYCLTLSGCVNATNQENAKSKDKILKVGAENTSSYLSILQNKTVAVVTNQTGVLRLFDKQDSIIGKQHLVDFLLDKNVNIKAIFAPEHGFRGKQDAGAAIKDGRDSKTGLPIYSLHGKHKKPQKKQLQGIDVVLFDIQDVGVRFYTYISTLHYVMEACAENKIPLIVLDRPNPNGHFVDGPVMEKQFQSFLGMHPVPVVYGMTIGEYAKMIEGEHWLSDSLSCKLSVVKLKEWTHNSSYDLPIKPSPNLPNEQAVNLYPSLCFFEQTNVSIGRGTATPFQMYGSPDLDTTIFKYTFTPQPTSGAGNPKHKNIVCYGENLAQFPLKLHKLDLQWLIKVYHHTKNKTSFFKKNLEKLTGTATLRQQIVNGQNQEQIRESWQENLKIFQNTRKKYLLYPDFEE